MSDADILTSPDEITHECQIGGHEITLVIEEPTMGGLEEIDKELGDESQEADVAAEMVRRYLAEPDVDPSNMGLTKLLGVYAEMQSAIQTSDAIEDARDAMSLDEGNP
jgi:hypothetical protein